MTILAELQTVSEAYRRLEAELCALPQLPDHDAFVTEWTLRNANLLRQVEQITAGLAQTARAYESRRFSVRPEMRAAIKEMGTILAGRAEALRDACAALCSDLRNRRSKLGANREELQRGTRYLRSVTPAENNFPKFVDSVG